MTARRPWIRAPRRRPLSIATGVLRPRGAVDLGRHFGSLWRLVRGRSLADYGAWAALNDRDAAGWLAAETELPVADYFYEPMLQGFYFQPLRGTSPALAMPLGVRAPQAQDHDGGGIGCIPESLAVSMSVPAHPWFASSSEITA
jgi:hypothetical protein